MKRLGSLCVALALWGAGCGGRTATRLQQERGPATGPKVALIDLGGGAPESQSASMFGLGAAKPTFDELLQRVDQLGTDKDVRGAMLLLDGGLGQARAWELGQALAERRAAGLPVHCHANGYSNTTLMLAALACDKIAVAPAGEVEAVGLAAQVTYMRKLLVEELHFAVDFLQVGKFKGAEEPLTRDGPSDEARASMEGLLQGFRQAWLEAAQTGRGEPFAAQLEQGPFSPGAARERGLVDAVEFADETLAGLAEQVGAPRREAWFGKPKLLPSAAADAALGGVVEQLAGVDDKRSPVALLVASGSIAMGGDDSPFGGSGIGEASLSPVIRKLRQDDTVKAVVLRIDSPGGSALASDLLWHELRKLREKKPLVVSVGDMAASGGYYMASAAQWVVASPLSLVGSIGVVGGKIGFGPALERWGVHTETFAAKTDDPDAAVRAAYMSPLVAWNEPVRERVRETMSGVYELFLQRIVEGRGMERARVEASAEGRVFSGAQGLERGLVDELGGLQAALRKARELGGLPADAKVRRVRESSPLLEALGGSQASVGEAASAATRHVVAEQSGLRALAERAPHAMQGAQALVTPLLAGERALCAAPYVMRIE